ncbi:MAG: hypothetical protein ABFS46_21965 [Myxococcota bacterium]
MARNPEQEKDEGTSVPSEEDASGGRIPDLLRKGLSLGFSGLFMTEEAVRRAFGDTVPRDWIDFATAQSARTRSEFLERLSGEIARSLESIDLVEVLDTLLSGRTLEVRAEIRLKEREPGEAGGQPSTRLSLFDRGRQTE